MKILILGGAKRYQILEQELQNNEVLKIDNNNLFRLNKYNINKFDIIILPMNGISNNNEIATEQGSIILNNEIIENINSNATIYTGLKTEKVKELFNDKKIVSFLDDFYVNNGNNLLTTKGIIEKVEGNKICILGYGNIAKLLEVFMYDKYLLFGVKEILDKMLLGELSFYTRDIEKMNHVFRYSDYIINTAPNNFITLDALDGVKAPILDIASKPYGASKEVRESYENYEIYSQIPAKYDYVEAGNILVKKLKKDLGGKK